MTNQEFSLGSGAIQPTTSLAALTEMVPSGAAQGLIRDIAHVMAKACLSSIPLAALAFDIGDKLVAFSSKKTMTVFLHLLAAQIDQLKGSISDIEDRLTDSPLYRSTAEHGMILVASGEENEEFLAALRNAALNLGIGDPAAITNQEVARVIRAMTPLQLRLLLLYDRFWNKNLSIEEESIVSAAPNMDGRDHGFRLGALAKYHIAYPYLSRTVGELRRMELLEPGFSGGLWRRYRKSSVPGQCTYRAAW